MRPRVALAPILGLGLLASACTSAIGVAIVAVAGGAAVLASDCPDMVDITVRDGATGGRTCAATVTATRDGDTELLKPCYHAHLGDGTWLIRASYPGYADEVSTVIIAREGKCVHTVQTVELWLRPPGRTEPTLVQPSPPLPPPPAAPVPAPSAGPAPPAAAPPPPPAPAPSPAPPAKPPPATAPSAAPGVPPTERFPDRPAH
jgi:hypothetical protein